MIDIEKRQVLKTTFPSGDAHRISVTIEAYLSRLKEKDSEAYSRLFPDDVESVIEITNHVLHAINW